MASICCPQGTVYIDGQGKYSDQFAGSGTISNTNPAPFYGTCVILNHVAQNDIWAIASGKSPIPCPCCPQDYTYSSLKGACGNARNMLTSTVPCIPCVCVAIPAPTCSDCINPGHTISFSFNPTIKYCIDCDIVGEPNPLPGKASTFFPIQLADPIINFTLRT